MDFNDAPRPAVRLGGNTLDLLTCNDVEPVEMARSTAVAGAQLITDANHTAWSPEAWGTVSIVTLADLSHLMIIKPS